MGSLGKKIRKKLEIKRKIGKRYGVATNTKVFHCRYVLMFVSL